MNLDLLARTLDTTLIGRTMLHFNTVGSTNAVALDMAERGAPEGTVVMADFQQAGRGRRGRQWIADPGDCLLSSTILRPRIAPSAGFYLTMIPALAVLDAAASIGVTEIGLKWPNDVQIRRRKVAGILAELSLRGETLDYVVVGIGLNVNLDVAAHEEIAGQATSLGTALGRTLDREEVAVRLLRSFEERYLALVRGEGDAIFADWRRNLTTLGQVVEVGDSGQSFQALAEDVTTDGGLMLRRNGERIVVHGGEVTLTKNLA